MVTRIPLGEAEFHPHSFGDRDGRLFRWNGRLYRALAGARAEFFRDLLTSGVIERLAGEGLLVETEPTALQLEGYELVVRHREVPFPSYPIEWSPTMFRDATLVYLRLLEQLLPLGLTLKDVHPWNLLFDFTRPLYVDLTSLVSLDRGLPDPEKIARYYLRPLLLMQRGGERIVRSLLFDYDAVQAADLDLLGINAEEAGIAAPAARRRLRSLLASRGPLRVADLDVIAGWRHLVEAVSLPDDTGKQDRRRASNSAPLAAAIERLRPASVLLLEEDGDLPKRAAESGSDVVVLHERSSRATNVYRHAREAGSRVLPLTIDFSRPTPSIGFSGHYAVAAAERLRCDLLVVRTEALRRLAGDRSLPPELLVEGFAQFAGRWLALERDGSETLDAALRPRFRPADEDLSDGRVLLLEKAEP